MEEHFFLISCNKANRWLTKLDDSLMDPDNLDRLNQHLDKASFVRNKREHDEEYSGESPKAQPMYTVEDDGSGIVFNVSPGVTMFSGDRILLGGMLEVNECADSAALIRAELQGHQRLYWNNRNARAVELYCSPDRLIDLPEGG